MNSRRGASGLNSRTDPVMNGMFGCKTLFKCQDSESAEQIIKFQRSVRPAKSNFQYVEVDAAHINAITTHRNQMDLKRVFQLVTYWRPRRAQRELINNHPVEKKRRS